MKTVKNSIENTLTINKSVFIASIINVKNKEEAMLEIDKIKTKYKDASHYCYAYIIDDIKKSSDDKEPGGTAGIVIMDVLDKFELNYVICIVTRYFGGIKLGAGGLVRAYRKAVIDVINSNKEKIVPIIDGYKILIKVPYSSQKDLERLINGTYTKEYDNLVTYFIECDKATKERISLTYDILEEKEIKIY